MFILKMKIEEIKRKRFYSLVAIIVGLPLSIVAAVSQSIPLGGLFGSILALGIDSFLESYKIPID